MNKPLETLYQGKFIEVVKDGHWEYVRRTNQVSAVCITALTKENEVILIEQYRLPLQSKVIELPAGLVGDDGHAEDPLIACGRELMEETGYETPELIKVCEGPTSSGLTNETMTYVIGNNAVKKGEGGGIEGEDITVVLVPLETINTWLENKVKEGIIVSPKIYTGLYWLNQIRK